MGQYQLVPFGLERKRQRRGGKSKEGENSIANWYNKVAVAHTGRGRMWQCRWEKVVTCIGNRRQQCVWRGGSGDAFVGGGGYANTNREEKKKRVNLLKEESKEDKIEKKREVARTKSLSGSKHSFQTDHTKLLGLIY